jgi:hypothetical protein
VFDHRQPCAVQHDDHDDDNHDDVNHDDHTQQCAGVPD